MADIVFVLGAGASRHTGAPLMFDFLQTARHVARQHEVDFDSFRRVERAEREAQAILPNISVDNTNVEVLFNLLDVARLLGGFPQHEPEEIEAALGAMKVMIAQTLDYTVRYGDLGKGAVRPPSEYSYLAALVDWLVDRLRPKTTVATLVFNYDIAFEVAIDFTHARFDYNLTGNPELGGDGFPLLKLHGSSNWWECSSCGGIGVFSLSSPKLRSRAVNDGTIITPYANRKDVGLTCKKCAATFVPSGPPFIVPPTWNKTAASNVIQNVWRSAAHHLREARHIVVVGYSFPPTDEYFKLLLGLGMASGAPIDTFAIVDPNADAIAARIRKFLGPALDRSLRSVPLPFAQGLVEILPQILAPKWRDGAREEIKKRARIMQRGEYPTD